MHGGTHNGQWWKTHHFHLRWKEFNLFLKRNDKLNYQMGIKGKKKTTKRPFTITLNILPSLN